MASSAPKPEDDAIASRREQLYASRRLSASHGGEVDRASTGRKISVLPTDDAPASARGAAKERRRSSPMILAAGGLLGVGLLVVAILSGVSASQRGSPTGKLRSALLAADIEQPGPPRDAKLSAIDAEPDAAQRALELLGDAEVAADGSTRSSHTYRELAAELLMMHAAKLKLPPPPQATKVADGYRNGNRPNEADWKALQDAWKAWLSEPGRGGGK